MAGWSTILSQPPNEGARYGTFKESTNILVVSRSPATCTIDATMFQHDMNLHILVMQNKTQGPYLETDNTAKTRHLTLGNVMFWMTWQAWIIDSDYLEK